MKQCKIYNHTHKIELDAVIIDKQVLIPMPRIENKEPTKIIDGQCYYPPRKAEKCPKRFNCKYFSFSVVCEWDEFMDFSDETKEPYPDWVAYYVNGIGYEMDDLNITKEKWGYCDICTGEIAIPPQWDWCDDFGDEFAIVKGMGYYGVINEYGDVCIYPDYYAICYVEIKRAKVWDGIFFVKTEISGKWGAMDVRYSEFEQEMPDVRYKWDDIWWDGYGGYTVMEKTEEKREMYGIVNKRDKIVVQNLTEKPKRYNSRNWLIREIRENSYRSSDCYPFSFRIIERDYMFGLVVDEFDNMEDSRLLLEPAYFYEDVIEAADKEDMEREIAYYAHLVWKTPAHVTTIWENMPQDIIEDVRKYMDSRGWKQGGR